MSAEPEKTVPEVAPEGAAPADAPAVGKPKKEKKAPAAAPIPTYNPVPVADHESADFGDLPLVCSAFKTNRVWTELKDITAAKDGEQVLVRARVHSTRAKGKTCFIQLRTGLRTVQAAMFAFGEPGQVPIELVKYAGKVPAESLVDVYGVVKAASVESCTQKDAEIAVTKFFVVSASVPVLPFQMADANRYDPMDNGQENEETEDTTQESKGADGVVRVLQKSRLDNRWLDLRTMANHAIFRLQSRVGQYFRQYFLDRDFVEIHSPKITPGVSEGGAQVFRLKYFGNDCCLAQSPQLYKQMGVTSDLGRVFEIGPVFRAENANTHRHMCEFIGLDFEMEIREHYHEVLKTLSEVFVYIFDQINANCAAELGAVNAQYPFQPLKYNKDVLIIDFKEARQMLLDAGEHMDEFADPSTPQEKLLGRLVKAKYDVDLYIVDKYPKAIRPFYTMPCPVDSNYTNSYDVFLRGEEITSGAQRIHDMKLLAQRANECGIPEDNISAYLKSFQYGAQPHGGAGVGLERVVMLFLGLNNIRKTSLFPRVPNRYAP
jgi:aspartyl-tRNA synthetase